MQSEKNAEKQTLYGQEEAKSKEVDFVLCETERDPPVWKEGSWMIRVPNIPGGSAVPASPAVRELPASHTRREEGWASTCDIRVSK